MEHEKYSYVEALRWLANRYNVTIEEETETSPERRRAAANRRIASHSEWFCPGLFQPCSAAGRGRAGVGLAYLKERGFRDDIIEKFQLGYDPQTGDAFAREAVAAQYSPELLQKAGWYNSAMAGLSTITAAGLFFRSTTSRASARFWCPNN